MMKRKILEGGLLFTMLALMTGCVLVRPALFWREPQIFGKAELLGVDGRKLENQEPSGVTLNFINLEGRIEESLLSVETNEDGKFRSPELAPGEYTVEALLPGFGIEKTTARVRSHEHKRINFVLRKIHEASGHFMRESAEENIPQAGEVQIAPPTL
jgi:hypothetical protein